MLSCDKPDPIEEYKLLLMGLPPLNHDMVGIGCPLALQDNSKELPKVTVLFSGETITEGFATK